MLDIWAYLDIIEISFVDNRGNTNASAVPSHMELRMVLVDILRQLVDTLGVGITTHKGYTGNVGTILRNEIIDGIGVKRQTDVFPKIMAVTPRTVTRAIRDVYCQCHFVGYLLEYYTCVYVFQHFAIGI